MKLANIDAFLSISTMNGGVSSHAFVYNIGSSNSDEPVEDYFSLGSYTPKDQSWGGTKQWVYGKDNLTEEELNGGAPVTKRVAKEPAPRNNTQPIPQQFLDMFDEESSDYIKLALDGDTEAQNEILAECREVMTSRTTNDRKLLYQQLFDLIREKRSQDTFDSNTKLPVSTQVATGATQKNNTWVNDLTKLYHEYLSVLTSPKSEVVQNWLKLTKDRENIYVSHVDKRYIPDYDGIRSLYKDHIDAHMKRQQNRPVLQGTSRVDKSNDYYLQRS